MWIFSAVIAGFLIWAARRAHLPRRWFCLLLAVDVLGGVVAYAEARTGGLEQVTELVREAAEQEVPLTVETGEGERLSIDLAVPETGYSEAAIRAHLREAVQTLDGMIAGENRSLAHVTRDLALPETVGDPAVSVSWFTDRPEVLDDAGVIGAGVPETGTKVVLTGTLRFRDMTEEMVRRLVVFPSEEAGSIRAEIERETEMLNAEQTEEEIHAYRLPAEADGVSLRWYRARQKRGALLSALAGIGGLLFLSMTRRRRVEAEQARREEMERDYPELISKLCLFLGAGLTMRRAFARIAEDDARRVAAGGAARHAYEEVARCCRRMERGLAEQAAYEEFGDRCATPAYRGLSLLLTQNLRRGRSDLLHLLEQEMAAAFEQRKRSARAAGEKVTIKLLLPMGMMLAVVIALIMIPAFMSL